MPPSLWEIRCKVIMGQTASLLNVHDQPAYGCNSTADATGSPALAARVDQPGSTVRLEPLYGNAGCQGNSTYLPQ